MNDRWSRRKFLRRATPPVIGTGLLGCPSLAGASLSRAGPGDELSAGLIGCGSRGPYLAYVLQETPGARVTALCDVHRGRLAKAEQQMKHLGGHPATYADYRKLLDDKNIDVVIVATNGHWHVLPAVDACAAGKDVYLEKPVGTSIGEGRAAVRAARRHRRIVQMGTQQRSWEHYLEAVETIRSGALGEISHVHVWDVQNFFPGFGAPPDGTAPPELDWEFWLGPSPRVPYNPNRYEYHYWFFDYGGGWEVAWGTHHYDVVHWAMGVDAPVAADGMGGKLAFADDNREWPDTFSGSCVYPPGPVARNGFLLTYTLRSGSSDPVEGRGHGKAFYGTNGVLILNRQGYEIRSETRGEKDVIEERRVASRTREHEVVRKHVRSFVECVRARRQPVSDIEVGHRATNPGHLMNIAWRARRQIRWDPRKERVIDDPQADALVTKVYRRPWMLPG